MGKATKTVAGRRCNLAEANILVVGPSALGSVVRKLVSFAQRHRREKSACMVFIAHPLTHSVVQESEFLWVTGSGSPRSSKIRRNGIPLVSHFLDMVLTLLLLARVRRRYDTYIGGGLHLIFLGILLRKIGLVKYTVGWGLEYWPKRFGNRRLLNWLYRKLDGYCFSHVDYVLNTTSAVAEARVEQGILIEPEKQISVPHMVEAAEIGFLSQSQQEPDSLVWSGNATPEYGFELVLDAMPLVLQKRPTAVVDMTSYENFPNGLRQVIADRGLEKHFRLSGYIKDEAEFRNFLRKHRAGLAPYYPDESSQKKYGAVSRPIEYMANGVPPIITRVPQIAAEIEITGAGVVIDYDKTQLANAILALLSNDELHRRCQQRGLELVKNKSKANTTCRDIFTHIGLIPDAEPMDE